MRGFSLLAFSLALALSLPSGSSAAPGDVVPLRIVGKSSDSAAAKSELLPEPRTYTLTLKNDSRRTITAWKLSCLYAEGSGNFATTGLERDTFFLYERDAPSSYAENGIVLPGTVFDLVVPRDEQAAHPYDAMSCRVAAVIFADASYAGEPRAVADLFERRTRIANDALRAITTLAQMIDADPALGGTAEFSFEELAGELSRDDSWSSELLGQALASVLAKDSSWPHKRLNELLGVAREEYALVEKHLRSTSGNEVQPAPPNKTLVPDPDHKLDNPEDGCLIRGGGTSGGKTFCSGPSSQIRRLQFSVTALCKNPCTGETWQQNSATLVATGACSSCGAKYGRQDKTRRINPQTLEYYTEGESRRYNTDGLATCERTAVIEASTRCSCPGCGNPSPILITMSDTRYELTDAAGGVRFDLDADGTAEQTAWTARGSDDGFLALDRNLNGTIDDFMEIFGDHTPQLASNEPNGWLALAVWDDSLNGGNEDGVIDVNDYIFTALQIWVDTNHNGYSEPDELSSLEAAGIEYLPLDYGRSERIDRFGNQFKFWANVGMVGGRIVTAWDVFFVHL